MRGAPVARAVRGGLTRRRVPTLVISLVVLVSAGASVLGLALAVDSDAPFDHAFAAQRGAQVTVTVNAGRATRAELAATARLPQVSAAAGPFAEAGVASVLEVSNPPGGVSQGTLPELTLAGRASPGGPVDDVQLHSGHWPDRPGQVVLSSAELAPAGNLPPGVRLGAQITVTGVPGRPVLTVVGTATSVSDSADGWVEPAGIDRLRSAGTPATAQLLYRFRRAGSAAAVRADIAAVTAALPPGTVATMQSYLTVRAQEESGIAGIWPFVLAFGVIGLLMSGLIVVNVVSGAVVAGYRRIGILKSIGFTPGQVMAAYTSQALLPGVTGCTAGIVLGNVLARPLLGHAARAYGVGGLGVPAWADAAVGTAMCALVAIAALVPAARAGRLSAVQAIAAGRAPRTGRGHGAHRRLGRLRLPRPATIGLAAAFARPARTAVTLAAVLLGVAAVTLMVGLGASLGQIVQGLSLSSTEQVQVALPAGLADGVTTVSPAGGPGPGAAGPAGHVRGQASPSPAAAQQAVAAVLRAQPGTLHYVAEADVQATAAGLGQPVAVTAFRGAAHWTGYGLVSGHWYAGPGQVDVPTYFLTVTGLSVGDAVPITVGGRAITVRIAGEIFDSQNNGLAMITSWATLARADLGLVADQYDVGLAPGTSAAAYADALRAALGPDYQVGVNDHTRGLPIILGLLGTLTLLLAAVAGLGVLNTVLLQTRDRVHDLGVFKAVGMTPGQVIVMVVCWVAGAGLAAGVIAVPAGIALQRYLLPVFAAGAGARLPASYLDVYPGWEVAVLALAGVVIAVAGALPPAGWAARARTAAVLRAG